MPRPRKSLICLHDTPYYHCVSRCVRRAFLCGEDHYSGKSYEHRRHWVEGRLLNLAKVFAIDVCAYAVMSNHTHVVLHVDKQEALSWATEEVLSRWHRLHKGTLLTQQYMQPERRAALSEDQISAVLSSAAIYRHRLYDISWFMRLLNEFIAREANKEDDCTGRFWEGRFKSQALLDEAALAACMAYVDLNPIRAGMAKKPVSSDFTSIKKRIQAAQKHTQPTALYPFIGNASQEIRNNTNRTIFSATKGLPFHLDDYIALVTHTSRQLSSKKDKSNIDEVIPIIQGTGLNNIDWLGMVTGIESRFSTSISLSIAEKKLSTRVEVC